MVILWRLVLLENELRAQFCIDFGCCLFWAFSLFLIIPSKYVSCSPQFPGYELSFSPSQPGFPTQLGQKKGGMNASLFVNIVKKDRPQISMIPFPYKKDGLHMAEQQVLTKWCLCWGSGSKHASKTHIEKKVEIKHPRKIYFPTKCGGAAKSWLVHKTYHFVWFFCLHPIFL